MSETFLLKRLSLTFFELKMTKGLNINELRQLTHGIVHAGFSGFRAFVARKKSRCKLIGFRFAVPHDTIP